MILWEGVRHPHMYSIVSCGEHSTEDLWPTWRIDSLGVKSTSYRETAMQRISKARVDGTALGGTL
jgi:hypothetical protein